MFSLQYTMENEKISKMVILDTHLTRENQARRMNGNKWYSCYIAHLSNNGHTLDQSSFMKILLVFTTAPILRNKAVLSCLIKFNYLRYDTFPEIDRKECRAWRLSLLWRHILWGTDKLLSTHRCVFNWAALTYPRNKNVGNLLLNSLSRFNCLQIRKEDMTRRYNKTL